MNQLQERKREQVSLEIEYIVQEYWKAYARLQIQLAA